MNPRWTKTIATAALTTALVVQSFSITTAYADGAASAAASPAAVQYQLTQNLKAEVKSVYTQKTTAGTVVAAVVKLENTGTRVTRVPEYELRVKTAEGIEYTLESSAANPKAVQAKSKSELSYMMTVDREDTLDLAELNWVKINYYAYPKEETVLLSTPVASLVWRGEGSQLESEAAVKKWGEAFTLPSENQALEYTALFSESQSTEAGPVTLVAVQVENKGSRAETVPSLAVEAKAGAKTYQGRLAKTGVEVKQGERQTIYFLIPTDVNETLDTMHIMTVDSFVNAAGAATPFSVGRIRIDFAGSNLFRWDALPAYKWGEPMVFRASSDAIDKNLKVSMLDFSLNESNVNGFRTAVIKLLLRNDGNQPLKMPDLGLNLTSKDGYTYSGMRQTNVEPKLMPNLGYVVHYSFALPSSEKGENLILQAGDVRSLVLPGSNQTLAYTVPLTGYRTAVRPYESNLSALPFYPYTVNLKDYAVAIDYSLTSAFPYHLKLNLDIQKSDNVVASANSSYMKVELIDNNGLLVGSSAFAFSGERALFSGKQSLMIPNLQQQYDYPLTIKIYEAFQTPGGEAKHLLATLKQ